MNILKLLLRVLGRVAFILPIVMFLSMPISDLEAAFKEAYINLSEYFTAHGLRILNDVSDVEQNIPTMTRVAQLFGMLLCLMCVLSDKKATLLILTIMCIWSYQ